MKFKIKEKRVRNKRTGEVIPDRIDWEVYVVLHTECQGNEIHIRTITGTEKDTIDWCKWEFKRLMKEHGLTPGYFNFETGVGITYEKDFYFVIHQVKEHFEIRINGGHGVMGWKCYIPDRIFGTITSATEYLSEQGIPEELIQVDLGRTVNVVTEDTDQ